MADSRSLVGGTPVAMISASWLVPSENLTFQLSLMMVVKPLGPCSASIGSASEPVTPVEGPSPRTITSLGTLPVMMNPPMPALSVPVSTRSRVERLVACAAPGVDVGVGVELGLGVGVGVGLGVGVGVGVIGVDDGVGVGVGVCTGVGVGVGGPPTGAGPWIATVVGAPVLKKPIVAFATTGALVESNRKLYNVPQRIAFAFGFWAKVSEFQVRLAPLSPKVHSALLNPASPCV